MNAVAKMELGPVDRQLTAKELGAFYTDQQVAQFLIQWAIRLADDTVLDPSFGGGVFLRCACQRLAEIGGDPSKQVFGVEIDRSVHARIADKLSDEFAVARPNLAHADFFDVAGISDGMVDAVVGNPPFIRYQRFNGEVRKCALAQAKKHGVQLKELSSSWAPFLIHSVAMLKPGGRLAMVVPMEIGHAAYALPVLQHLARSFREVTFLTFRKKLFPDLSEDTLLLLAEDRGTHRARFLLHDLAHPGLLEAMRRDELIAVSTKMDEKALSVGKERLIEYLLPRKTRELYHKLTESDAVVRLGGLADVGIGYVTGANDFFHLGPDAVRLWEIPEEFLLPAIRRGRSIVGLRFDRNDWLRSLDKGEAGYLLHIRPNTELPDTVRKYVSAGEQQGIAKAYKCRTREPWFAVPHVRKPDAFLSYMSGNKPHFAANEAGVVAPNSLHLVEMRDEATCGCHELAALWRTSLTQLSAEIEGHPLGGGMLKLEPTEAEKIAIAWPSKDGTIPRETIDELDSLVRMGRAAEARQLADETFLETGIGLDKKDCRLLQEAAELLHDRRYHRGYAA